MTIAEVLLDAAAAIEGLEIVRRDGAMVEFRRSGVVVAVVAGDTAEFRLEGVIARAALGTPDTSHSTRGSGWVAFRPKDLDRMAVDRAVSWLASAFRHAATAG